MIRFDHVSFTYTDASTPILRGVDLHIPEGEFVVVVGETGYYSCTESVGQL